MSRLVILRHAPLVRFLVLLIAFLQVGAALVPHTEAIGAASADSPHVQASDDPLEPAHNEAACPACLAQHTRQLGTRPVRLALLQVAHSAPQLSTASNPHRLNSIFFRFSRAPPFPA
ncbi:MAG: hypothetical protein ACREKM_01900 [Longimicrobiales bacterium]